MATTKTRAAREALVERSLFRVDAETHAKFVAALDAPPAPNDKLRRTMQMPAPWDLKRSHSPR